MNEQLVRKLAREAGFSGWDSQSELLVKFANSLVKECIEQTRWQEFEMSVEQRIRLSVARDIKEHFGVKE